jgi:CubicO group peptidase (beta-lactamase class C family)
MHDLPRRIQEAIDELVESDVERGLQVAVHQHGDLIVDAVSGIADPTTGRAVTSDTPFHVYSTGKGVTATVVHVLAERGALDYDTPIVEVWPEFGAHAKQAATLRHVLTHSVGVPGVPPDTTPEDLCDWHTMCAAIADAEPWWKPGTKTGYHSYTFGYIVGEIVRRVTGKPISQVLREEVAGPLGVADELFFGMPESELGRLAPLEDSPGSQEMLAAMPEDSPMFKAAPVAVTPTAELGNRTDILMADIPAVGKMTARAVTRMYAALLGEVDGVRLVSDERLRQIAAVAMTGVDQIAGLPTSWALGYAVGLPGSDPQHTSTWFGMAGAGGTAAYADTATGIAFAVSKNRLTAHYDSVDRITAIIMKAVADG